MAYYLGSLLIVGLATAFVIAGVERFINIGSWRGVLALASSGVGMYLFENISAQGFVLSMGSAFLAMGVITAIEKPTVQPLRRLR